LNTPSLSVITATWNAAATLRYCLESVATQVVKVEHVLIDGHSTDATLGIVRQYPHVSPIVSEPDRGIYDAMNKGLRLCTGDIVGILNADDWYADDRVLERVAKAFEDPEVDACYGDLVYVTPVTRDSGRAGAQEGHDSGNPSTRDSEKAVNKNLHNESRVTRHASRNFKILRYWKSGPFSPEKFKWGWMPPHPTFFVRRSVYERFGLFNLDLGSAADYELMLRFLLRHRINVKYIPEVLVYMRVGGASNESIKARIKANRNDRKAWEVNGLKPYPWTLWMKPLRKIPQYFLRP
jgi:glycosyltransferase